MVPGCLSKNNAFLMFPMLGENWHNNHHAAPGSLSTWVLWYQVDFIYLTGRFFELLGLATDIRVETQQLRLRDETRPPTGFLFPAMLWTLWLTIFFAVWWARSAWRASVERHETAIEARESNWKDGRSLLA